jgi:predicted cupin superfamily sugar epimerase
MAFYAGSLLTIYFINETKRKINEFKLGHEFENGEKFETLIIRSSWYGAKVNDVSTSS